MMVLTKAIKYMMYKVKASFLSSLLMPVLFLVNSSCLFAQTDTTHDTAIYIKYEDSSDDVFFLNQWFFADKTVYVKSYKAVPKLQWPAKTVTGDEENKWSEDSVRAAL